MHARPLFFAFAAGVAGCCGMCAETTSSENVRTEGMAAEVRVEANDDQKTSVDVVLRVGGPLSNVFPQISGGDHLEVTNGIESVPLAFSKNVIARPSYFGQLRGDSGGQTIQVRFDRTTSTSALGTKVIMPPSFMITSPPAGTKLSSAHAALTVTWSPPGPTSMEWSIEGACIQSQSGAQLPDTGRLEVALAAATPADGGPPPSRCDVAIRLTRSATGTVDPAFGHGGAITATQRRELSVSFAP